MIDKLAVILAGEYRTWPKVSKYIFNFFTCRAKQVDYFFVTWNLSAGQIIEDTDVTSYFKDQNLIRYGIFHDNEKKHTYYKQTFLAKIGNIFKKEHEFNNNFVYDQVVVTRPDFYFRKNVIDWEICPDFYYQIGPITKELDNNSVGPEKYYPWIQDVYVRSSSATDDILSQKYFFEYQNFFSNNTKFTTMAIILGHHHMLAKFLMERNLLPLSYYLTQKNKPYPFRQDYESEHAIRSYHEFDNIDLDTISLHELTTLLYRR